MTVQSIGDGGRAGGRGVSQFLEETSMFRKAWLFVALMAASGSMAAAQDKRVELAGLAGWTFSDGVSGGAEGTLGDADDPVQLPGGDQGARLEPVPAIGRHGRCPRLSGTACGAA